MLTTRPALSCGDAVTLDTERRGNPGAHRGTGAGELGQPRRARHESSQSSLPDSMTAASTPLARSRTPEQSHCMAPSI
jgi:hypothetical protein